MSNIQQGCRLIATLLLLSLIFGWENIALMPKGLLFFSLGTLFLILNILAAIGIYREKTWGFVFTYLAILYSTIFLSVSYIPFLGKIISVMIVNLIVCAYVVYLNILYGRKKKV